MIPITISRVAAINKLVELTFAKMSDEELCELLYQEMNVFNEWSGEIENIIDAYEFEIGGESSVGDSILESISPIEKEIEPAPYCEYCGESHYQNGIACPTTPIELW